MFHFAIIDIEIVIRNFNTFTEETFEVIVAFPKVFQLLKKLLNYMPHDVIMVCWTFHNRSPSQFMTLDNVSPKRWLSPEDQRNLQKGKFMPLQIVLWIKIILNVDMHRISEMLIMLWKVEN